MIYIRHIADRAINLLLTVPLILIKQLVLRTDNNETNIFASVMTIDEKLAGHSNILAGQFQDLAGLIVIT